MELKRVTGVICEDPLNGLGIGQGIRSELVTNFGGSDAIARPTWVENWDFFRGAILGLAFNTKNGHELDGTAVMVAPGLAVTTTHIFQNVTERIRQGTVVPYCYGVREGRLDIWKVTEVAHSPDDDIALLAVAACSKLPEDRTYYRLGITARAPRNGEPLHVLGFRRGGISSSGNRHDVEVNLYASRGSVTAVYPRGRDKTLVPYPAIELDCGSLGGMSGGAAIDENGLLVGVISRGLDTAEQTGPTYVSWIIKALTRTIRISWPPGVYKGAVSALSIDPSMIAIVGREALPDSTAHA
jgi:hypothetical protein